MKLKLSKLKSNWPIVSIKQISRKVTDGEHVTPERTDSGILLLSARNVLNGQLDLSVVDYIPDSEYQRIIKRCHPEEGDILISCSGTIGRVCVVPENQKFTLVRSVALVKLDRSKVSSDFIAYLLQSDLLQNQMKRALNLSAQPNLFLNAINKLKLPLPEQHQQHQIARILKVWDDAIATTEELITVKHQLKRGLEQKLLNSRGIIRNDWSFLKAKDVFTSVSERNFPDAELLAVTQKSGVVPRDDLEGRVMMPEGDTSNYKLVKQGDFVISLRSFQGGIEYSDFTGLVSPAYTVLRATIPIVKSFYRYYFKSYEFIQYLAIAVVGIRDGKQVSYSSFSTLETPVPPLEEQSKIAEILDCSSDEIECLEQYLSKLKQQKSGLMQKLLTGEWPVKVKEVA